MWIWEIIAIVAIASILIEIVIYFYQKKSGIDEEYEEESEQDKFYRALRHLIYLITALILIPIIIKILFVVGIISIGKNK